MQLLQARNSAVASLVREARAPIISSPGLDGRSVSWLEPALRSSASCGAFYHKPSVAAESISVPPEFGGSELAAASHQSAQFASAYVCSDDMLPSRPAPSRYAKPEPDWSQSVIDGDFSPAARVSLRPTNSDVRCEIRLGDYLGAQH